MHQEDQAYPEAPPQSLDELRPLGIQITNANR